MTNYIKIYKAMYYCVHNRCDKCPYSKDKTTCYDSLMKDTLQLLDIVGELLNHCESDIDIDDVYDQL